MMPGICRTTMINSNKGQLNSDYDFSMLRKWALGHKGGLTKKSDFIFDKESGRISAGSEIAEAVILCKRPTSYPLANQTFLAQFQFSGEIEDIPTAEGTKIFIEIKENLILDPTLIQDPEGESNYAKGFGIGEIKAAQSWPTHENYLKLYEIQGGELVDLRKAISLPALDEVAQRTSTLESTVEEVMERVEQIENTGTTNFVIQRTLGEDIEPNKAYFLAKGIESTRTYTDGEMTQLLMPQISAGIPGYQNNVNGIEFDDKGYRWKFSETPAYSNWSNCHFRIDPSGFYRDGGQEYDYTGNCVIELTRLDGKEFLLNRFQKREYKNSSIKVVGVNDDGTETTVVDYFSDVSEKVTTPLFYKKYKFYGRSNGGYIGFWRLQKIGAKIAFKKTIDTNNPLTAIYGNKGDKLNVVFNRVGVGASLRLRGAVEQTIDSPTETVEYYFTEDGMIYIQGIGLSTNSYFSIGDIIITRGGDANKKYKSDPTIDWRNKIMGIEKEGGVRNNNTVGVEMGIIKINKPDGYYYIGNDLELTTTPTSIYVGQIIDGYLKFSEKPSFSVGGISNSAKTGSVTLGNAEGYITVVVDGVQKKVPIYGI